MRREKRAPDSSTARNVETTVPTAASCYIKVAQRRGGVFPHAACSPGARREGAGVLQVRRRRRESEVAVVAQQQARTGSARPPPLNRARNAAPSASTQRANVRQKAAGLPCVPAPFSCRRLVESAE